MAKRKIINDTLNGISITCNWCVATAGTPAMDVTLARQYVAQKWGWVVTPSGHHLCPLCVLRGVAGDPEHKSPPRK